MISRFLYYSLSFEHDRTQLTSGMQLLIALRAAANADFSQVHAECCSGAAFEALMISVVKGALLGITV